MLLQQLKVLCIGRCLNLPKHMVTHLGETLQPEPRPSQQEYELLT